MLYQLSYAPARDGRKLGSTHRRVKQKQPENAYPTANRRASGAPRSRRPHRSGILRKSLLNLPAPTVPMDDRMRTPSSPDMAAGLVDRAEEFARNGNRFGVIAALGRAMEIAPTQAVRSMMARALAPLTETEAQQGLMRQMAAVEPDVLTDYETCRRMTAERLARRAALPDRVAISDAFVECVTYKTMMTMVEAPLAAHVAAYVGDFFGRLAAREAFGGDLPVTSLEDDVYSIGLGMEFVRLRHRSAETRMQSLLFFLYEPGLLRWISGFGSDDVFLDVGANIGKYSVVAGRMTGARTYALEPFSTNFEALVDNIALNDLTTVVTPLRLALSDSAGAARLRYETHTVGQASQNLVTSGDTSDTTEAVVAARLDDLIADGTVPAPTRIKIDVDGEEWRLIEGMQRTLRDPRLQSIRIEIRDSPENAAAVRRIEDAGFAGASDDDQKNVLFVRRTAAPT